MYHKKQDENVYTNIEDPGKSSYYCDIMECKSWQDVLMLPRTATCMSYAKEVFSNKLQRATDASTLLQWEPLLNRSQRRVLKIIQKLKSYPSGFRKRTVLFVTGPYSSGKTTLARFLQVKFNGLVTASGDPNSIALHFLDQGLIILDLPKDFHPVDPSSFATTVEKLADGVCQATLYQRRLVTTQCPLVVFTNMDLATFMTLGDGIRSRRFIEVQLPPISLEADPDEVWSDVSESETD